MSWKLIIYAWNPLILLETGNGLHFETLIIAILMISLFSLENDRPTTAALGFLIAFFLKYYSIFPIILFWKHFQRKGQLLISIGLGSYLGAVFLDPTFISGLLTYANDWNFNSSIFGVVNEFISIPFVSKLILAVIFLFLLVFYSQKAFQEEKLPHNYTIIVLGTLILFQPTFHPWYLLWLFPFLLLDRESIIWSWILLSGTIILSYSVHVSYDIVDFWKEPLFFRLLEYLPFYALLIYETRNSLKIVFSKIRYQLFEKIKIFPRFSFR
jgi:hypothetical protein